MKYLRNTGGHPAAQYRGDARPRMLVKALMPTFSDRPSPILQQRAREAYFDSNLASLGSATERQG
jgi:hypothetical protein